MAQAAGAGGITISNNTYYAQDLINRGLILAQITNPVFAGGTNFTILTNWIGGVNCERIGLQGLFVTHGDKRADGQLIECDTVVLCAGQEPLRELLAPLKAAGVKTHLIGGADEAAELDAKRAIDQGTRLAATL